ncbi:hypothetical protein SAMD00019534_005830 [Acytostelium subglobosum LB1]|uniref:hypothetical protein n=1 Tax=Acytostelium subglobosum LB1 TaxID=1410327 RepID=UPI000644B455|nr:hypothetical protein SAMD00019534_005830 [Acytostelium subglobosum LB1]GAM17408.1 hypothetical protein SAMD00019534_005830 [Acytostelium subglobosum LB1]|eukprot:XP_012759470.1 hypothetical protein SAMD00019534_005830 [Acytostelium subglobosum LB1]
MSKKNVVVSIIGGGAAGLASCYFAARQLKALNIPGVNIRILERKSETGKKILMSGGSRCNVLPKVVDIKKDYFSEDMNICRRILNSWNVPDCHKWLSSEIGLQLALEEGSNKYFPESNSARDVRDLLLQRCQQLGVEVQYDRCVNNIVADTSEDDFGGFTITGTTDKDTQQHFKLRSDIVVLASGGLSFPAVGTDGRGYGIASRLGHTVHPTYAALTPLTGTHPGGINDLRGVSLNVELKCGNAVSNRSGMVFTHKGFSGPSVLDLSHHIVQPLTLAQQQSQQLVVPKLIVSFDGETRDVWARRLANETTEYGGQNMMVANRIGQFLPSRLVDALLAELGVSGTTKICELKQADRKALVESLAAYQLQCSGHEGYRKAEVTGGGVSLRDIDHRTLESKTVPGLFIAGELLDVFGRIGGFNFYWAWTTGRAAGQGVAERIKHGRPTQ